MSTTIRYVGAQERWPELPYTGKQSVWLFGQQEERSGGEADALLATGYFVASWQPTAYEILAALPYSTTWSNREAALALGRTCCFFTDVGVGGGSVWSYSGGRWRPYGGRVRLKNTTSNPNNATTSKVVLDYATLLPGLFQDADELLARWNKERVGGTSDTDATDMGIGTVAATFGNSVWVSTSGLAATNKELSATWGIRRESATSVRRTNAANSTGSGTSTNTNNAVTVANMDANTTYLQMSSQLTTGAGEVSYLRTFIVDLIAGA